ncbi:hypothetical protein BJF79_38150 [Actinomadura sp. CNU-125]|nr:hypothetical protein BJF79_38150 [Actinomadura sp. CNU-125]
MPGGLVEGAGGLVGEHDGRTGRERAGDRDALRLPARQLAGTAALQPGEAERAEPLAGRPHRLPARRPVQHQRERDVLVRGQFGEQLAELEDEPEAGAAQDAAAAFAQRVDALPEQPHLAAVRLRDPGEAVQQRRLPGTARAHDRDGFGAGDGEVHAVERDGRAEAFRQAPSQQDGIGVEFGHRASFGASLRALPAPRDRHDSAISVTGITMPP